MTGEFDEKLIRLSGIVDRMDAIAGYGRRTRRLARILLVSFILDVALTVGLAFLYGQTHASQLDACAAFNRSRADQVVLWRNITGKLLNDPSSQSFDRKLNGIVHKTFKTLDCASLYHTVPAWIFVMVAFSSLALAAVAGWQLSSRIPARKASISTDEDEEPSGIGRNNGS